MGHSESPRKRPIFHGNNIRLVPPLQLARAQTRGIAPGRLLLVVTLSRNAPELDDLTTRPCSCRSTIRIELR